MTLAFLVNTVLLAVVTRRIIGIPVGWPRTVAVSALYAFVGNSLLTAMGRNLGIVDAGDRYATALAPELVGGVFLLMLAWGVAFGVASLIILEVIVPTGALPLPWTALASVPARLRRQRRYAVIIGIATRYGLSSRLGLGSHQDVESSRRLARGLRMALTDAGVTFVKFGQMLSTRADLIGEELARELSTLTSDVEPVPWSRMEQVLVDHVGAPVESVFAEVDPVPLAAASLGQVHVARLLDGREVVVKLQRPGAHAQVTGDLDILRRLARRLETRADWARDFGVAALVEGFAASLNEELDYRVELANCRAVAATMPPGSAVRVPQTEDRLSGRRVLVMERVHGTPLTKATEAVGRLTEERRCELVEDLLGVVLCQILDTGVFHADLHGGNVLLDDHGSLVLLDFGSVGRLDRPSREALSRLILAVDHDDAVAATDALLLLLDRPVGLDDRLLERGVGGLLVRAQTGGDTAGLFGDLLRLVVRHGFSVPGSVAAVFRSIGALEGTLNLLDPRLDLINSTRAVGEQLFTERMRPDRLRESLETRLLQSLPLIERMPRRVDAVTRQLEDGEFSVRVRMLDDSRDRAFLTGLVREITTAVIAAACAVVAVVLLVAPSSPVLAPGLALYPLLGATFLLFAFVLASRVLALALGDRSRAD